MEIEFLKMQGCGEDVVLIDTAKVPLGNTIPLPALAHAMLDRGFGVGGTLLVLVSHDDPMGLSVRCFDADGDESPPSCNALRCVAHYASDSGAVTENAFSIRCMDGERHALVIDSANVRIDMGLPFDREKQKEILEKTSESFTRAILVGGRSITYTPISLGTPFAILFVPDFSFPLRKTARAIAEQPDFPDGTDIGFVQVYSRDEIRLRVWEQSPGAGADCACSAAALVASVVNGFTDREIFVHLRGGDIFLQWDESDNHIYLTGPADYVFSGVYDAPGEESR